MSKRIRSKGMYLIPIAGCLIAMCFIIVSCMWHVEEGRLKENPAYGIRKEKNIVTHQGKKYQYDNELINVLILGVDKKGTLEQEHERGGDGQTDAIFLVSLNVRQNKIKVFCIPRDSMVPVKRMDTEGNYYDTQTMQLTLQYAFGDGGKKSSGLTAEAVAELMYQIPFSGYYALDLEAVRVINDAVGGIDVTVNDDFTWYTEDFPMGETVHLEGDAVMEYLQVRNTNQFGTSMGRLERQKAYIEAFVPTAKKAILKNPRKIFAVSEELKPYMETSFEKKDTAYFAAKAVSGIQNKVEFITIPGELVQGEEHEEYYVDDAALYEMILEEFYQETDNEGLEPSGFN